MDAGQTANHSHTAEWMKEMCRHMFNKVSKAKPQLCGLEKTLCGLFNHAVLGEVHGSVTGNDLRAAEPAECAGPCALCRAGDKHPGCILLTGSGDGWRKVSQKCLDLVLCDHCGCPLKLLWRHRTHCEKKSLMHTLICH